MPASKTNKDILIVTGLSGAGKSTALHFLEDMDFETIDNFPLSLFDDLLKTKDGNPFHEENRPLAIGMDLRTRGFNIEGVSEQINNIKKDNQLRLKILFMDCDNNFLVKRFSETRRRHPISMDTTVIKGIQDERKIMEFLKVNSDIIVDTSGLTIHDTRRRLKGLFKQRPSQQILANILAFGFSKGVPRHADLIFDVRFLKNPYYQEHLRLKTGKDEDVGNYIMSDKNLKPFVTKVSDLLLSLLPLYKQEGKSYLTIAFGCTGGQHRSVFIAKKMQDLLDQNGYRTNTTYRDIKF